MLSEEEIDRLTELTKQFVDHAMINFPNFGQYLERDVISDDGHEKFKLDISRKGKLKSGKCTFQERYAVTDILFRLDIEGPPHENPNGDVVPCPHLHVYREGYADKWAFPLEPAQFSDIGNLMNSFREFLVLCNIHNLPEIQASLT